MRVETKPGLDLLQIAADAKNAAKSDVERAMQRRAESAVNGAYVTAVDLLTTQGTELPGSVSSHGDFGGWTELSYKTGPVDTSHGVIDLTGKVKTVKFKGDKGEVSYVEGDVVVSKVSPHGKKQPLFTIKGLTEANRNTAEIFVDGKKMANPTKLLEYAQIITAVRGALKSKPRRQLAPAA